MLVLDNGDALRGIAEVASKLSFTVHGYVGTTATQLASGQLGTSEGDLYASGADATVVTSITITNTDSAARTFTLYFLESGGGTSWAISPVSLDLGIGHSFYTDGQRIVVMDATGQILNGWSVDDTPVNGSTTVPISSNWAYDHTADVDAHVSGATAGQLLVATAATTAAWQNTSITLTSPTINGTIATSGLTMPAFTLGGTIAGGAQELNNLGKVYIGDTANAQMTLGLTINQGSADDEIEAFKSSDVAHGRTTRAETDTYGLMRKVHGTHGGLGIWAIGANDGALTSPLTFLISGGQANTTKSTGGLGMIDFIIEQHNGSNTAADVTADGNLLSIRGRTGGAERTRFLFDIEGSGHSDVEWTTYQHQNDLALIADMEACLLSQETESQTHRRYALEEVGIIGKDSWHIEKGKPRAMVNFTKLAMLHHGALIQAYEQIDQLKEQEEAIKLEVAGLKVKLLERSN